MRKCTAITVVIVAYVIALNHAQAHDYGGSRRAQPARKSDFYQKFYYREQPISYRYEIRKVPIYRWESRYTSCGRKYRVRVQSWEMQQVRVRQTFGRMVTQVNL